MANKIGARQACSLPALAAPLRNVLCQEGDYCYQPIKTMRRMRSPNSV